MGPPYPHRLSRFAPSDCYEDSSRWRFLAHLAWAAFFAMADLSAGASLVALLVMNDSRGVGEEGALCSRASRQGVGNPSGAGASLSLGAAALLCAII